MTRWLWFLAGTAVVLALTVGLAALTGRAIRRRQGELPPARRGDPPAVLGVSRRSLYLNAAASQALMLLALGAVVGLTGVTAAALHLPGELGVARAVGVGVALGVALGGLNLAMQGVLDAVGVAYDDSLRELLTPATPAEWAVLLVVVLPVVAGFEELLFRGVLVGALSVGFAVSPWLLAVVSSVAFAAGHGLQGPGGLLAAGVLGLVLAAAFILTGSLVAVVVAHYVVNAIEFARHR